MKTKTLIPFLVLTFGLSWGIAALLILFTDQMVAIFGEITNRNPLYIFMAYSPGIVGIFLVWRHYGLKGLELLSALDLMADATGVVAVSHCGHSYHRIS